VTTASADPSDDSGEQTGPGRTFRKANEARDSKDARETSGSSDGAALGPAHGVGDAARPGAGEVTATVIVNAPAERVFAGFTAWERQGEWIPFTRVRVVDGDGGEGSSIEAVSQLGPAVLRDDMRVLELDPPRMVRVVHYGRVLRGPGVLRCTPMAGGRTQVVWHEWLHLPGGGVGRVAWPLLWPGSKLGLSVALRRFARLVEAGELP
jgi:hypothetical protein